MNSRGLILTLAILVFLPGFGWQATNSGPHRGPGSPQQAGEHSLGPVAGAGPPPGLLEKMRSEGVRRVLIETRFAWRGSLTRGRPENITVSPIVYFSRYSHDCAQIADPRRLAQIRASGLEGELEEFAVERTRSAHWLILDKRPRHLKRGVGVIRLFDDNRVPPAGPDILVPAPSAPSSFRQAVGMNDVARARALVQGGVSLGLREEALWNSLGIGDLCMTALLLGSGVSPSLRDQRGRTPLMVAAGYGAVGNVKALLAAGADPNAKTPQGETALSIAARYHHEKIVKLLEEAGARH